MFSLVQGISTKSTYFGLSFLLRKRWFPLPLAFFCFLFIISVMNVMEAAFVENSRKQKDILQQYLKRLRFIPDSEDSDLPANGKMGISALRFFKR